MNLSLPKKHITFNRIKKNFSWFRNEGSWLCDEKDLLPNFDIGRTRSFSKITLDLDVHIDHQMQENNTGNIVHFYKMLVRVIQTWADAVATKFETQLQVAW